MEIREASENYLETILRLEDEIGEVHSIHVVKALGYSKPTVSIKMHQFKEEGLIDIDDNNHIRLLPKGREIAEKIYKRHIVLTKMLEKFGVNPQTASADACKMEHDISDETFECIEAFLKEE